VLVAYEYDGKPITDDHGGPVRTVVPKRYFYKSAKWLLRLEFTAEDQLGYWERGGYSNTADPWKEERYSRSE
jgi:DMSO/TMAO reductase YedYZ molybdopterin-dependent catalytic subunit